MMAKNSNKFKKIKSEELKDLGYEEYAEMFQEGMSDSEISRELGVDEKYVKKLRNEYQNDY